MLIKKIDHRAVDEKTQHRIRLLSLDFFYNGIMLQVDIAITNTYVLLTGARWRSKIINEIIIREKLGHKRFFCPI